MQKVGPLVTRHLRSLAAVTALLMPQAYLAAQNLATGPALEAAIAGSHRSEANKARDRSRHPKETLEFFGLTPDMTVVEIWPGGGWYTDIVAPTLNENGKLYAATYGDEPPFPYQQRETEALKAKLAAAPGVYGDVTITALDFEEGSKIAPDGSADLVLTFRNVHNWLADGYGPPNAAELAFKAMFAALKPGGTLGVVDHRWPDPATEDPKAEYGYVSEQRVIELAETAGFELAGRSDVNRNPRDTHEHPRGVWTLPPDLALGDQDRQKYVDIGESDRLTLKFVKPRN
jgi:predicted methyltransferase